MGTEIRFNLIARILLVFVVVCVSGEQENGGGVSSNSGGGGGAGGSSATTDSCYGAGSIAAAVILTFLLTLLLQYVIYVIWKRYWKNRTERHLVLETDPEKGGKEEFAFDNDGFRDPTLTSATQKTGNNSAPIKSKWNQWSPLGALMHRNEKQKTLDDSYLQGDEVKIVSLKSHDFTGLGFNIYGNMRDGIFIKDILHRGPASQSGKLNPGDRIQSITVNFEHVVYEDALTILSYASPYEVILEAKTGKFSQNSSQTPTKTVQLGHPLYRSSSATDLMQITKSSKKRLFPTDSKTCSPYSSLQKITETNRSKSPEWGEIGGLDATKKSPQQLKTQLEQKISQNHKQQLKVKDMKQQPPLRQETEIQKTTENKYQKFGIKVLPVDSKDQISPKSSELSQNDNNINLERHMIDNNKTIDEVDDKTMVEVKKIERDEDEPFVRQGSITGSGIKRDKDGIPQEIPNHMLNAAVAARRNRKASADNIEEVKSPKKPKGRAPAPPDPKSTSLTSFSDLTAIALEDPTKSEVVAEPPIRKTSEIEARKSDLDYASDSDVETDNQSSVNTIELNASDITVHQAEENEDVQQNRKTASTGDLTKIQRARKTSSGTLERAQSLDITDTGMPILSKKRKGGSIEENFGGSKSGSDESLYGKALIHKEPRLSLALDGLNTFQRSRLKKSTEWGNLEDAVLNIEKDESLNESKPSESEFDALVNKINEIKRESLNLEEEVLGHKFEFDRVTNDGSFENFNGDGDVVKVTTNSFTWRPAITKMAEPTTVKYEVEVDDKPKTNWSSVIEDFLVKQRRHADEDPYYDPQNNKSIDVNAWDDLKVSRHLEKTDEPRSARAVNSISLSGEDCIPVEDEMYVTASDETLLSETRSPDLLQNLTLTEAVTIEGPTSLTLEIPSGNETSNQSLNISTASVSPKSNYSLTYITEIQVMTPTNDGGGSGGGDGDDAPDTSEPKSNSFEQHKSRFEVKTDPEKELHKIQEIVEEQLKKLPEMRFTTSSYESPKSPTSETTYSSHIEHLRSNFEKSPPSKSSQQPKVDIGKSRIPVATSKTTPPTSPERRDSRNFDLEVDREIVAIMSSPPVVHSTPNFKYQPKINNKNVSVTSIRSNSRIPSGLPSGNRPPVPPRRYESDGGDGLHRISTNGNATEGPIKQWLFNPNNNVVTNVTVMENKNEQK